MKKRPQLSPARGARIWTEMLSIRREFHADHDFFKMIDVWEMLCSNNDLWSIKSYRSSEQEDYKRKAGIVVIDDRLRLTVDERIIANARRGCKLANFILAHEFGHLALNHHARSAVTKHFQLFSGPNGMANIPPTQEELEANYAAVMFQCGVALADSRWSPLELANRAFSDAYLVERLQRIVRLDVFQREVNRPKPKYERVIL